MTALPPVSTDIEIRRCPCGHPACKKFLMDSGYDGRFSLQDALLYKNAPLMLEFVLMLAQKANGPVQAEAQDLVNRIRKTDIIL